MIGQFVAFALGFIGDGKPDLIFSPHFVYLAASGGRICWRCARRHGVPVSYAMMTQFATLSPEAAIDQAVQTLLQTARWFRSSILPGKPVGVLGRADLIRTIGTRGWIFASRCHGGGHADHQSSGNAGAGVQTVTDEIRTGGKYCAGGKLVSCDDETIRK